MVLSDAAYREEVAAGLCLAHAAVAAGWRDFFYDPRRPREPGGGPLMDSRTSHDQRARGWDAYNADAIRLAGRICRSGRSPQCSTS